VAAPATAESPVAGSIVSAEGLGPIKEISVAAEWVSQRNAWIELVSGLNIVDQESFDRGGELLAEWTSLQKAVEANGKKLAEPYKEVASKITSAVREFIAPGVSLKDRLAMDLGNYTARMQEQRRAAVDAVSQDIAQGREVSREALEEATASTRSAAGTATVRSIILTITDPDKVPREFCSPDTKKVNVLKQALDPDLLSKDPREIVPGITAHVEFKARSTGRGR